MTSNPDAAKIVLTNETNELGVVVFKDTTGNPVPVDLVEVHEGAPVVITAKTATRAEYEGYAPPVAGVTVTAAQTPDRKYVRVTWAGVEHYANTDRIELWGPSATSAADGFAIGSPPPYVTVEQTGASGALLYAVWGNTALTYEFRYVRAGVVLGKSAQVSLAKPGRGGDVQ